MGQALQNSEKATENIISRRNPQYEKYFTSMHAMSK
jgi:hypothetical protein